MATLRERIRKETNHSDAGDTGWVDKELGLFLWWAVNEHLKVPLINFYSKTVDLHIPDDAELEAVYARYQIEGEDS